MRNIAEKQRSRKLDYLSLKTKALRFLENSVLIRPKTRTHM